MQGLCERVGLACVPFAWSCLGHYAPVLPTTKLVEDTGFGRRESAYSERVAEGRE